MVIEPSLDLFHRMQKLFGTKRSGRSKAQNYDMDIVNLELACKSDQVLVLPKHYGTLDSEYSGRERLKDKAKECRDFSHVQFLHFTAGGKPWTRGSIMGKKNYNVNYEGEVRDAFAGWFALAHEKCPTVIKMTLD